LPLSPILLAQLGLLIKYLSSTGCDVSRLRDFIVGFYVHNSISHPQSVDDAFYNFVWSIILQVPTVRVGIVPEGAATEVYIAPQTSAKRKAKAKGEECIEEVPPVLDLVPNAKFRPLDDLKGEYGDSLRIAVDPDTSFAAITGSHIRVRFNHSVILTCPDCYLSLKPSKLSPMVYTALQLITRGRENGISVVELGKKSRYDQKTCFYLIRQLLELDLV
jgi:oxalate---CoA ligase